MTVIAAVADGQTVWMASDTASIYSNGTVIPAAQGKVRRHTAEDGTPYLLGFAGMAALKDICRTLTTLTTPSDGLDEWAQDLAAAICKTSLDPTPPPKDADGYVDGGSLLACSGRLWILNQQSATPLATNYWAIGSGADLAVGYLTACRDWEDQRMPDGMVLNTTPGWRLKAAIRTACQFDTGCAVTYGREIEVLTIGPEREA